MHVGGSPASLLCLEVVVWKDIALVVSSGEWAYFSEVTASKIMPFDTADPQPVLTTRAPRLGRNPWGVSILELEVFRRKTGHPTARERNSDGPTARLGQAQPGAREAGSVWIHSERLPTAPRPERKLHCSFTLHSLALLRLTSSKSRR